MQQRKRTAGVLAGLALFGAVGLGVARNIKSSSASSDPEATIYAMLDAARAGDVARYLDYFTTPALDGLRQTIRETGAAGFSKYLRETNGSVEGIAIAGAEISAQTAKFRVEYVFPDRNATQYVYLSAARRRWRIERVDAEESNRMPIPFGTLVK